MTGRLKKSPAPAKNSSSPSINPPPDPYLAPYVYAEWAKARVNIDYHIEVKGHYYSVPFPLVHEQVDVRLTPATSRSSSKTNGWPVIPEVILKGQFTALPRTPPTQHQNFLEWTPERIIRWAQKIGPHTALSGPGDPSSPNPIPNRASAPVWASSVWLTTIPQTIRGRLSPGLPDQKPLL